MVNLLLDNIHTITYWINMVLFLPVPFLLCFSIINILRVNDFKQKIIVVGAGAFGVISVCLFIVAQASWMVLDHGSQIPSWAETVWAMFDFFNVAFYLMASLSLYVQSNWIKNRTGFENNKHLFFCEYGDVCDVKGKSKISTDRSKRSKVSQSSLAKEIK